jgi:hypothetical protein
MLSAMRVRGVESIIDRAIQEGEDPDEVALECCRALKLRNECDARIAALKRDASIASRVPAGEAPLVKPKNEAEGSANKSIVQGFRRPKRNFKL